jgi:hypothetical protein
MKKLVLALSLLMIFSLTVRAQDTDLKEYMEKLLTTHKDLLVKNGDAEKFADAKHEFIIIKCERVLFQLVSVFTKMPYVSFCFNYKALDGTVKTVYKVISFDKIENGMLIQIIWKIFEEGRGVTTVAYDVECTQDRDGVTQRVTLNRELTTMDSRFELPWDCLKNCGISVGKELLTTLIKECLWSCIPPTTSKCWECVKGKFLDYVKAHWGEAFDCVMACF